MSTSYILPVFLTLDDVCQDVEVPNISSGSKIVKKRILHKISLTIPPGRLVAVMGSSGAGKSTLMDILTNSSLPTHGSISWNGSPLNAEYNRRISFVHQEDLFFPYLTVEEHLNYQAELRLPSYYTKSHRTKFILKLIKIFGLEACMLHKIGGTLGQASIRGISGGERKRLSIATELMSNPSLVFLDEPTSGLDSYMAVAVISQMKSLTEVGRSVVCTIHQPSSDVFEMFDWVLLLSEGRLAFNGPRDQIVPYFSRLNFKCPLDENPGDYIIRLLAIPDCPHQRKRRRDLFAMCMAEIFNALDRSSSGREWASKQTILDENVNLDDFPLLEKTYNPINVEEMTEEGKEDEVLSVIQSSKLDEFSFFAHIDRLRNCLPFLLEETKTSNLILGLFPPSSSSYPNDVPIAIQEYLRAQVIKKQRENALFETIISVDQNHTSSSLSHEQHNKDDFIHRQESISTRNLSSPLLDNFEDQPKKTEEINDCAPDVSVSAPPSFLKLFWILLHRAVRHELRNPVPTYFRFIQTILVGFMLGAIFFRLENGQTAASNKTAAANFLVMQLSVVYVMAVAHSLPHELMIISREHKALGGGARMNLKTDSMNGTWKYFMSFYWSKVLSDLPFQIVLSLLSISISYYMVGFNDDITAFTYTFTAAFLLTLLIIALMYALSAFVKSTSQALQLGPAIIFPLVMFNGFLMNSEDMPSFWKNVLPFEKISFYRYSFRAIIISIFHFNYPKFDECPSHALGCFENGDNVIDYFIVEPTFHSFLGRLRWDGELLFCFLVLCAYIILFHVLGCYIMVSGRPSLYRKN